MKDELAARALAGVLDWDAFEVASGGADLQALAALKYDEYEGFRPGEGFLEHLTSWLAQMTPLDRQRAVAFVRQQLVFVSRAEMDHAIETVYPDVIRPILVRRTATLLGAEPWRVKEITESREFSRVQRKTLVLGLGDGARIDRLRRTSELSHEQFYLAPDLSDRSVERMRAKLQAALTSEPEARFEQVVLVDDFAGSGYTSLRQEKNGDWDGRLERARAHLEENAGAIAVDPMVVVVLYAASTQAREWIDRHLEARGLDWELHVVQELPASIAVSDDDLLEMCRRYFDDANYEVLGEHVEKVGDDVRLGFGNGRLPVVLSHNTPNNSISILWADTVGRAGSNNQRGLFPRRHRHNAERP